MAHYAGGVDASAVGARPARRVRSVYHRILSPRRIQCGAACAGLAVTDKARPARPTGPAGPAGPAPTWAVSTHAVYALADLVGQGGKCHYECGGKFSRDSSLTSKGKFEIRRGIKNIPDRMLID